MFACLVWDFHTVVSYQRRNPVFEGSTWRLHSVNQGCGSGGAGIPHSWRLPQTLSAEGKRCVACSCMGKAGRQANVCTSFVCRDGGRPHTHMLRFMMLTVGTAEPSG